MEPDDLLCSRNARSQKTLVGWAQVNMDRSSPEKVECPYFSDSKEETEVAGKKHHKNVVLDARDEDCDHQDTEEGRPWRGDRMRIQKKNWKSWPLCGVILSNSSQAPRFAIRTTPEE